MGIIGMLLALVTIIKIIITVIDQPYKYSKTKLKEKRHKLVNDYNQFISSNNVSDAMSYLKSEASYFSKDASTIYWIANRFREYKEYDLYHMYMVKMIRLTTNNRYKAMELAKFYEDNQEWKKAIGAYNLGLEIYEAVPNPEIYLYGKAVSYFNLQHYRKAKRYIRLTQKRDVNGKLRYKCEELLSDIYRNNL